MKPKSICFVSFGKWEWVHCLRARSFGENLRDLGWEVHHLLTDIADNRKFESDHVHVLPASFLKFVVSARSLLTELNPSYIHFLNPAAKAMSLTIWNRTPIIVGDWEDWHAIDRYKGIKKYATRFSDWYMRRRSDVVIVTSRWLQGEFKDLCSRPPQYVPYAALPREFPKLPNPFPEPTAVFMGSLQRNWDHDVLLDAALRLKHEGFKPPIKVIGPGNAWEDAKRFCEQHELNNVELTGYLDWDEMLNNLQWAHVLLFPIRDKIANRARCPFKVFQYAQAKRPIVTSRVGEVPTFLNEKATYTECTPKAFADQIRYFMQQPRQPDVDYEIDRNTWSLRTRQFVDAIESRLNDS